jgi:hypothetical protein
MANPFKLRLIPNQMVVAFPLPEGSARKIQYLVGAFSGESFESLRQQRQRNMWTYEHVNVIGHDGEGMEFITPEHIRIMADNPEPSCRR